VNTGETKTQEPRIFEAITCNHLTDWSLSIRIPFGHIDFSVYQTRASRVTIFGMQPADMINLGLSIMREGHKLLEITQEES